MKIRIILADDHTIVRQGIRLVLNTAPDIEVVGEVENGTEAVALAVKLHPDIVLLDLSMPELGGLEAARQIIEALPQCKVLMLSSYSDEDRVRELIECGIAGYVVKQTAGRELLHALRKINRGNNYFSACFSPTFFEAPRQCMRGTQFT